MDDSDLDEVLQIAKTETTELLSECERLLFQQSIDATTVAELFQRVHTAKSNIAVIPSHRLLSQLLQNLETVLALFRSGGTGIESNYVDFILKSVEMANRLVEWGPETLAPDLEREAYRCVNSLRLNCSKIRKAA